MLNPIRQRMDSEINDVYLKTDSKFKLKLKTQMKGSGLFFERLLLINDLVTGLTYHFLIVNDEGIHFNSLKELYTELTKLITKELKSVLDEIDLYGKFQLNNVKHDKNQVFIQLEELFSREQKLHLLLKKIEKNITKIQNSGN